jgi:ammonium transporter, Amt family
MAFARLCRSWGGIAAGIFGYKSLGGLGGISFLAQISGTGAGVLYASTLGSIVCLALKYTVGLRLRRDEEFKGSDLSIHHVSAYPEQDFGTGSPTMVGEKRDANGNTRRLPITEPVTE